MQNHSQNARIAVPNRAKTVLHASAAPSQENALKHVFEQLGISYADAAKALGLSRSCVRRIVNDNKWPRGRSVHHQFEQWVAAQQKLVPAVNQTAGTVSPPETIETETEGDYAMLLQNQSITPKALEHFGLPRNPFVDDVQSSDDVYQTPSVRYVRAALMDAAKNHGFVAVVSESGGGKSTLAEDLEERIKASGEDILIIRPYVLGMEGTDTKGKTLRSIHIAEAVVGAIDANAPLKRGPQARFAQLHNQLKASRKAGRKHLLLIEEAHCLPLATLKHLKRFLELKDGMQRLIGVALIGQPELRQVLGSHNAEVREVAQRCAVVELDPLDDQLEGYLAHKFARFGLDAKEVFADDAFDAIRARLIHTPRGGRTADAW